MYTRDDYIKDCFIAENGSAYEKSAANVRKYYYEVGRIDAITSLYPEFADKKAISDESDIAFLDGKWYVYSELDNYVNEDIPDRLFTLYGIRSRLAKNYIFTKRSFSKGIEEALGKNTEDSRRMIKEFTKCIDQAGKEVLEIEQKIQEYKTSDEYKEYMRKKRKKKSFWSSLFS